MVDNLEIKPKTAEILMFNSDIKFVCVEVKTPGFQLFSRIIPISGDLSLRSLLDRFHDLHREVEGTIKKCGMYFPTIENKYLTPGADIIVYFGKSYPSNEYVRILGVEKPNGDE